MFIKFGQMLSTRRDLLPEDIADELAKLQDDVPPFPEQQSIAIIEKALGKPVTELFASFEPHPWPRPRSHRYTPPRLHSGEKVVVKVVRPDIEPIIRQDLALMFTLARLVARYLPDGRRLRPVEVVSDYEFVILDELDLGREAANASQLRRNFEDSNLLYIPEVYWDYTCRNVFTMERIIGIPVTDMETLRARGTDLKVLGERGVEIFFTQVFRDSFFHADMHPGNIFVDASDPADPPTSRWTAPSSAALAMRTSITWPAICWVSSAGTIVRWHSYTWSAAGCRPRPAYRISNRPCARSASRSSSGPSARSRLGSYWSTCSRLPAALTWKYSPRWCCCKKHC